MAHIWLKTIKKTFIQSDGILGKNGGISISCIQISPHYICRSFILNINLNNEWSVSCFSTNSMMPNVAQPFGPLSMLMVIPSFIENPYNRCRKPLLLAWWPFPNTGNKFPPEIWQFLKIQVPQCSTWTCRSLVPQDFVELGGLKGSKSSKNVEKPELIWYSTYIYYRL